MSHPRVPVPPRRRGHHQTARPDAHAAMRAIQRGTLVERYRALLAVTATRGFRTRSGEVLHALTDYEAAAALGVERTSINAARGALVREGLVRSAGKRRCRYRPSRHRVHAWALCRDTP